MQEWWNSMPVSERVEIAHEAQKTDPMIDGKFGSKDWDKISTNEQVFLVDIWIQRMDNKYVMPDTF
jgi:hypothetical protein